MALLLGQSRFSLVALLVSAVRVGARVCAYLLSARELVGRGVGEEKGSHKTGGGPLLAVLPLHFWGRSVKYKKKTETESSTLVFAFLHVHV